MIKYRTYVFILCIIVLYYIFLDLHSIIGLKKEGFNDGSCFTFLFHCFSSFLFYISLLSTLYIKKHNINIFILNIILFYLIFFILGKGKYYYLIIQILEGFLLSQCIYYIIKCNFIKQISFSIFPVYVLSLVTYNNILKYILFVLLLLLFIPINNIKLPKFYKNTYNLFIKKHSIKIFCLIIIIDFVIMFFQSNNIIIQIFESILLSQTTYYICKYKIKKPIVICIFQIFLLYLLMNMGRTYTLFILSIFFIILWYVFYENSKTQNTCNYISCKNINISCNNIDISCNNIDISCKNIVLLSLKCIPITTICYIICPHFISKKFNSNICCEQFFFLDISILSLHTGFILSSLLFKHNKYTNVIKYVTLLFPIAFIIDNKQISKLSFIISFILFGISFGNMLCHSNAKIIQKKYFVAI